jgi:CheY-like chemotaxis protein
MTEILQEKNFQVTAYTDPTAFLSQKAACCCSANGPCADVMIADNQMPGMSGLELLEHVRARGCKLPNDSTAIISGSWSQQDHAQAVKLGCKIFHKPTSLDEIWDWLDEATSPQPS